MANRMVSYDPAKPQGQQFHSGPKAELEYLIAEGGGSSTASPFQYWKSAFRAAAIRRLPVVALGPEVVKTFNGSTPPDFAAAGNVAWNSNPNVMRFENTPGLTDAGNGCGANRLTGTVDEMSTTISVHVDATSDGTWVAFSANVPVANSAYNLFINGHLVASHQTRWDVNVGMAGIEMQFNKGSYDITLMTGPAQIANFYWGPGAIVSMPNQRYTQVFIGDSYGASVPGSADIGFPSALSIPNQMEMLLGLPAVNMSQAGTGLVSVNDTTNGRQPYLSTMRRNAWNTIQKSMVRLVTVQCSGNDQTAIGNGTETQASLKAKYDTLFGQLNTDFPGVPVLALGVQDGLINPVNLDKVNAAAKASAQGAPNVIAYVDQIGRNFVDGVGNTGSPGYDGKNRSSIISPDDLHPSEYGYEALTRWAFEEAAA